jgi:hypothetical protein
MSCRISLQQLVKAFPRVKTTEYHLKTDLCQMLAKTTGASPRYSGRAGSAALPRHEFNFIGRFDGTWLAEIYRLGQTILASGGYRFGVRRVSPSCPGTEQHGTTQFCTVSSRYRLGKAVREARTERRGSHSPRLNNLQFLAG